MSLSLVAANKLRDDFQTPHRVHDVHKTKSYNDINNLKTSTMLSTDIASTGDNELILIIIFWYFRPMVYVCY